MWDSLFKAMYVAQIKQHRSDMQQEVKEKLANVSTLVSDNISTFRNLMSMLKTDVRTEMQHVYNDQANTIKSTLERLVSTSYLQICTKVIRAMCIIILHMGRCADSYACKKKHMSGSARY